MTMPRAEAPLDLVEERANLGGFEFPGDPLEFDDVVAAIVLDGAIELLALVGERLFHVDAAYAHQVHEDALERVTTLLRGKGVGVIERLAEVGETLFVGRLRRRSGVSPFAVVVLQLLLLRGDHGLQLERGAFGNLNPVSGNPVARS